MADRTKFGRATIHDVARKAGVSPMTASRVLNGGGRRGKCVALVLEAAERLNYVPNKAARTLASGGVTRLGLLYDNPSGPYLSELLVGLLRGARESYAQLVILSQEDTSLEHGSLLRSIDSARVEGLVLPPPAAADTGLHAALKRKQIPFVLLGAGLQTGDNLAIKIDNRAAANAMTNHLLSLGHQRIGFIEGDLNDPCSLERLVGFKEAMRAAGLDEDASPCEEGNFTFQSGLAAAARLLSRKSSPTAIFASNDDMAAAAIAVAQMRRISVPEQLSVAGFDDTSVSRTIWPELTTIRQPIAEMGEAAMHLLVELVQRKNPPNRAIVLPHAIVERQSCAASRESVRA